MSWTFLYIIIKLISPESEREHNQKHHSQLLSNKQDNEQTPPQLLSPSKSKKQAFVPIFFDQSYRPSCSQTSTRKSIISCHRNYSKSIISYEWMNKWVNKEAAVQKHSLLEVWAGGRACLSQVGSRRWHSHWTKHNLSISIIL